MAGSIPITRRRRVEVREVGGCKRDQVAVSIQITKDSLAHRGCGNDALGALLLPFARALVIGKEKEAILANRPADRPPEDITVQLQRLIREPNIELRLLHEIIARAR